MTTTKTMVGTVTRQDGQYFVVESPDAPAHLRSLNLVRSQLGRAMVGDRVRLAYQTSASYGLWNVVDVL